MWFARLLGLLTLLYSVVALIRPRILVTPAGLVARGGAVAPAVKTLGRTVLARDAAIGLAMMLAPMTAPLAWAIVVRIAADAADAGLVWASSRRAAGVALGWAALNAVALWAVLT